MRTLANQDFSNQRAVVRVDFNVPIDDEFHVTDSTRITAAKETIDYILKQGGSCVLISHLGRPKGKDPKLSLINIVKKVEEILGVSVSFFPDCVGAEAEKATADLQPGSVMLMENLRFYAEETAGDLAFAEGLSKLGDCYVNDAFGTAHRAHASTTIIAQFFNENKFFGLLLEKEVKAIEKVMKSGEKPVLAILGGAKVSSKITIIENMLDKIDHLIIGGGMVYTFAKAQGGSVGQSICEEDYCDYALELLKKAKAKGVEVHLPTDVIIADDFSNDANQKVCKVGEIPDDWEGLDAGPDTLKSFEDVVMQSKTILWNGPLGVFEFENFSKGTIALGEHIAKSTAAGAFSLVGGGDSVSAVKQFGFEDKMSYISTGGGAMLESLEGKTLPGIAALME
ncbi:phosphoglycerate kinase [Flavobacteriaceae bacterium]|nr:phosphoglycerate kinase [Flavobacteriaceae bacterium]MDA8758099.1 phosphoglycerate kinase [Flavobacteriaceae bacterium]MDA8762994.1 phosphoglycerate kinase [Flavobacteriaceae bacterium]